MNAMPTRTRLRSEQQFHDSQAQARADWFRQRPQAYRFPDDAYLDHETWIRPAFAQLGDVHGLPVLDYGCGHGMASVVLARRGAYLTAFDLSAGYVDEARLRAQANDVEIAFVQADAERLPFADHSFARAWGHAILHHLDLHRAAPELKRVMLPGGVAVFCEPWGENPVLNWARRSVSDKAHTPHERPLCQDDIRVLRSFFPYVEMRGYQLLGMSRRLFNRRWASVLDWCDRQLLTRVPRLQHFCRYVTLTLVA
jgi:SAM-dependent methyltransferase